MNLNGVTAPHEKHALLTSCLTQMLSFLDRTPVGNGVEISTQ